VKQKHPDLAHLKPGSAAYHRAWNAKFPGKVAEKSRRYRLANPGLRKYEHLKRYGLTREQYEAMAEAQGNRCAICGTADPGKGRSLWSVDHCHSTKRVRGLLCAHCNAGLGSFRDDDRLVRRALEYLVGTP
jgi:hypothetical protein